MSSTEPTDQWRPGDVANGHVLAHDGTWLPLQAPQPQPRPWHRSVALWVVAGVVGLFLLLAVVGAVAGTNSTGTGTGTGTGDPAVTEAAKAEIAWRTIDQSARDNICSAYRVSPAETKVLMLNTDSFTPALAEETMKILAREC